MAVETIKTEITHHTQATREQLSQALTNTIENGESLPDYLGVTHMKSHQEPEFIQLLVSGGNPSFQSKLHFTVDPDSNALPKHLDDRITEHREAYQVWRSQTNIRQNFTDDELTVRLDVTLGETGTLDTITLRIYFDMWGLPSSAMPTFNEILDVSKQKS